MSGASRVRSKPLNGPLRERGECEDILQLVASCRGALNGLMAELIEGHLRFHVLDPTRKTRSSQLEAADELMAVVKRYFNWNWEIP